MVTSLQAPLRSRTAGFPRSGSDLSFPATAFPPRLRCCRLTPIHPHRGGLRATLVPSLRIAVAPGSASGPAPGPLSAQSPFARLGRDLRGGNLPAPSASVTLPSSLLQAHAPVRAPPLPSGQPLVEGSVPVVVSPGCNTDLPDGSSVNPSPDAWTPTPVDPPVLLLVTSRRAAAFPA